MLPYTGKEPRLALTTEYLESKYSSSELEEEEENVTTAVVGQSKDRIILRTNRWF